MGLGASLAGGIVMSIVLVITSMSLSTLLHNNATLVSSSNERNEIENRLASTAIRLTSVQATPSSQVVTLLVNNTGSTKLWDFAAFDVIIHYSSSSSSTTNDNSTSIQDHIEKLSFAGIGQSVPTPAGSWAISSFINDYSDPNILNPGEAMELKCDLSNPVSSSGGGSSSQILAIVVTDNGAETYAAEEVV